MPIKLIPPRKGFSPYYYGRGTYLGQFVNRSTQADRPQTAKRVIKEWESEIERGRFATDKGPTFLSAAVSYMQAGGERTYVAKLIEYFGEMPLSEIDQPTVDRAAVVLYPKPQTRHVIAQSTRRFPQSCATLARASICAVPRVRRAESNGVADGRTGLCATGGSNRIGYGIWRTSQPTPTQVAG